MKFNRLLVLITPLFIFILFELFFAFPRFFYCGIAFSSFFIIYTTRRFAQAKILSKELLNFSILPILFSSGLASYSLIVASGLFVQILFFLNLVFLYSYFKNIYYYLLHVKLDREKYLKNMFAYGGFLSVLFFALAILGLQSLLGISIWPLIIIILLVVGFSVYGMLWINKLDNKLGFIYVLLSCLALFEIAWALSFLPLNYVVLALILSICYYVLTELLRLYLLDILNKKLIRRYLALGIFSIMLILLSAKWM